MSDDKDPVVLGDVVCSENLNQKKDAQASVSKLEKTFSCDFCSKKCCSRQNLLIHLRVHTGEKPYECELCDKKFSQKGQLTNHNKKHVTIHSSENQVVSPSDLTQEVMGASKLNECKSGYQCDFCEKKFATKALLSVHLRVHTTERPFECELCLKKFSQIGNLKTHYLIHTNKKPFQCNICKKSFVQKGNLQTHYKTHTKEKPFECSACNKKFTQKGNLLSHERTHHFSEKPYKCDVCSKTFATQFYFKKHSQMHTSDSTEKDTAIKTANIISNDLSVIYSYECRVCHSSFNKKQDLNLHYRVHANIVASNLNQITCEKATNDVYNPSNYDSNDVYNPSNYDSNDISSLQPSDSLGTGNASKMYDSQSPDSTENPQLEWNDSTSDTIDYLIDTNGNSIICGVCNKIFSIKPDFLIHYQIHAGLQLFECGICHKKFNQKQNLECHKRIHTGLRPFKCDFCPKSFAQKQNLMVHLRTHTGAKPYKCEECPKEYTQKNALQLHEKTAHGKLNLDFGKRQEKLMSAASYNKFKPKLVLRRQSESETWEVYKCPDN